MPGERIKRFLNRFIHIDENRNRTPSPLSHSQRSSPLSTAPVSIRQSSPSPPLAPSTRLQSSIPSPELSLDIGEDQLRARKAAALKRTEVLEEEVARLEKHAQELEKERNARFLELRQQTEKAEKELGVQTTRLHELENEIRRRREALERSHRESESQSKEEVRLAKTKASGHASTYERILLETPVSKQDVPWDPWELDADFFSALSRWTLDNPESTLDRVLQKISAGIDQGQPLLELIPDSPFPARGLVGALAHLLKLGAAVSRAQKDVRDFAIQVISWVGEMRAAFEGGVISREGLSWRMQANLETRGNLIHQICIWATAILSDGRWKQIKRGLSIAQQIEDFKARIAEARNLFLDASLINLTQGLAKVCKEIEVIRATQDEQLKDTNNRLAAEKQAEARSRFMDQTLQSRLVANPTYDAQGKKPCDPDTRIAILKDIREWLEDFSNKSTSFLWLTGDPGAGKSSITASIARECKDGGILWAQFFVNRNNVDTTDPRSFFPSIARQLANRSPDSNVARIIHDALKNKQSLLDDISAEQASGLFIDAVIAASKLNVTKAVVVVIDGLDEMDRSRLRETAKIFSSMFVKLRSPNVKVLVASRTEDDIRKPFGDTFNAQYVKHVHLDTAEESSILDVSKFITRKIAEIVEEHDLNWEEWPGERRLRALCDRASGLFIWAVTVAKFIQEQVVEFGTECLNDLLDELSKEGMDGVNILYSTILRLTYTKSDEWAHETFRRIVGCIVVLREPLCVGDIKDLLKLRKSEGSNAVDILNFVRRLRTVLVAGADAIDDETVPRLHKSFFEFITSDHAHPQFRVESTHSDGELAVRCLDQLSHLRKIHHTFNDSSHPPPSSISGAVRYAARFWALHLPQSDGSTSGLAITARATPLSAIQNLLTSNSKIANQTPLCIQVLQGGSDILISQAKEVTIWHPVTGKQLKGPIRAGAEVYSVAFSPDGTRIISAGDSGTIRLWYARRGRAIGSPLEGHTGAVLSVAFSPDETRVISGGDDMTIRCWDGQTGQAIRPVLKGHTAKVRSVAFSADGKRVVSGSHDKTIRVWDGRTGQAIGSVLEGHTNAVWCVAVSPDGRRVVSGSSDKTIRIWDTETGHAIGSALEGHTDTVWSVAFSPDGRRLVSGSRDKTIRFWDGQTGHAIGPVLKGHTDAVWSVAYSPDGKRVVSASRDSTIRLWNGKTGQAIGAVMKGHTAKVASVAFSPDGKLLVSGSYDKTIRLWDTQTGRPYVPGFSAHTSWISSVAPFPNSSRLASASLDGTVRIWDLQDLCQIEEPLVSNVQGLNSVTVSPDGTRVSAATIAGTIYLWDADSRKLISHVETSLDGITVLKFSSDGSELIMARVDGSVSRYNAKDGTQIKPSISHNHSTLSADKVVSFDLQQGWQSHGSDEAILRWSPFEDRDGGLWAYVDGILIRSNGAESVTIFDLAGNSEGRNEVEQKEVAQEAVNMSVTNEEPGRQAKKRKDILRW